MRTCGCFLAAITFVGSMGWFADVRGDEEKVALDKLPRAVVEAVTKRFPGARMIAAARETEAGKVEYEVTIKDGGVKADVMLTPGGNITAIEKEIAVKSLPEAVQATVKKEFPKSICKRAEEVTRVHEGKETLDFYEVLLERPGNKSIEVEINPDGKLRKREEKR